MDFKKHGGIMLNGFVVVAPILITVYVVWKALWGLDTLVRAGLTAGLTRILPAWQEDPALEVPAGLGIVIGVGAIYLVGLLTKVWLFSAIVGLGERIVARIPLVKSLYSAMRDLLQFLGGQEKGQRGKPALVRLADGSPMAMGLITHERPQVFAPQVEGRVAVYLPMSYQIGGYTIFLPRDQVEELKGMTVEDLMKLTLTAGVGAGATTKAPRTTPEAEEARD